MAYEIKDPVHQMLFEGGQIEWFPIGDLYIATVAGRFYVVRTDQEDRPCLGIFDDRMDAERFRALVSL